MANAAKADSEERLRKDLSGAYPLLVLDACFAGVPSPPASAPELWLRYRPEIAIRGPALPTRNLSPIRLIPDSRLAAHLAARFTAREPLSTLCLWNRLHVLPSERFSRLLLKKTVWGLWETASNSEH
jgi:hypothetical protein